MSPARRSSRSGCLQPGTCSGRPFYPVLGIIGSETLRAGRMFTDQLACGFRVGAPLGSVGKVLHDLSPERDTCRPNWAISGSPPQTRNSHPWMHWGLRPSTAPAWDSGWEAQRWHRTHEPLDTPLPAGPRAAHNLTVATREEGPWWTQSQMRSCPGTQWHVLLLPWNRSCIPLPGVGLGSLQKGLGSQQPAAWSLPCLMGQLAQGAKTSPRF